MHVQVKWVTGKFSNVSKEFLHVIHAGVERYAHLAPDHLANTASRLDSMLDGYDLATVVKK